MAVSGRNGTGRKRGGDKESGRKSRSERVRESGKIELRLSCVQPITERSPSGQFARIALDLHSRHRNTTVPPAGVVGVRGKAGDRREEGRAKKESLSVARSEYFCFQAHVVHF
jgi:hypothetical protein